MKFTKQLTLLMSMFLLLIVGCTKQSSKTSDLRNNYPNVLNIKGTPQHYTDRDKYCFSDLGSWHGFGLPDSAKYYGAFTGPFMIPYSVWQSKSLAKLTLLKDDGQILDFASTENPTINYYPGVLNQTFVIDSITVSMNLFFISNRTAAVNVDITNNSNQNIKLYRSWNGEALYNKSKLTETNNGVNLNFPGNSFYTKVNFNNKLTTVISSDSSSYTCKCDIPFSVDKDKSNSFWFLQSFYFDVDDELADAKVMADFANNPNQYISENSSRWNKYLSDINVETSEFPNLAVKALITLTNNWRSPAGALLNEGLFPSYAYTGFHGFWSWDSWKHSVALVNFAPELAKNQIRAMFDYQNKEGMIADCIFRDTTYEAVNWRDTKPPLASWAVLEVFNKTSDTAFVKQMLPKLQKYHSWWYQNRDNDGNGLCEYGSTDGTRIAAAWESGMDNAVRFDEAIMVENNPKAWSLNQESVDLNCYLYAEKNQIAQLLTIVGNTKEAESYIAQAEKLKADIQNVFYDDSTGFFYDVDINNKKQIIVQGPEGWIPLWTGVATPKQAQRVANILMDTTKFNTFVPMPTLAKDHNKFNPRNGYWRGPVWLDQAYFAIKGLRKYGFNSQANFLKTKLIVNAQGLANSDAPIRENYHPVTGQGLNANHFSWSAAHYLMLLEE